MYIYIYIYNTDYVDKSSYRLSPVEVYEIGFTLEMGWCKMTPTWFIGFALW